MNPGHVIAGRYEVRGILGRGGMGEVYLAHDHRLDTDVALKRVPLALSVEPLIREALVREARILARLSDTHIVRVFDLADTPDGIFIVLEFVCGPGLDKVIAQRGGLSVEELQYVMDHVSSGLTRAHSLDVIHRDLKPSNLLVSLSGEERKRYLADGTIPPTLLNSEIKVGDFGLAKVVLANSEASRHISGTPGFMAPEQFRGELPSAETDIYALGYVAWVCLVGKSPIGNSDPAYFHLHITPPLIDGVPEHINAAIQKAVRKGREQRFRSAADFAKALRTPRPPEPPPPAPPPLVAPPVPKPEPPVVKQATPGARQTSQFPALALAAIAGLLVVGLLVVGVLFWLFSPKTARTTTRTEAVATEAEPPEPMPAMVPAPPINPAPRIDEPPPLIDSARQTAATVALPEGIEQPYIAARAGITGHRVFGFGYDGTLYVTSDRSNIGAVRDGRLLWQYRLAGDDGQFRIAPDGLIWIWSQHGEERLFCFNSAGQGGEFVDPIARQKYLRIARPESQVDVSPQCVDPDAAHRDPGVEVRGAHPWRTALDHRCEGDPVVSSDGAVLVQTQAKTIYLLSNEGRPLWTYPAPCLLDTPVLLSTGTAVGRCPGRKTLVGIREGKQAFSLTSENTLSPPLAQDRAGTFYRFAETDVYDRKLLIRTASSGKDVWTLPVRLPLDPETVLSPDRKLYLLNGSPEGSYAVVIGDRAR